MVRSIAGLRAGRSSPATLRRSARALKPSVKGMGISRQGSQPATQAGAQPKKRARRTSPTDSDSDLMDRDEDGAANDDSDRALLLKVLSELKGLKDAASKQQDLICKLEQELVETKHEFKRVTEQLTILTRGAAAPAAAMHGGRSYADAARTPPDSPRSDPAPLNNGATRPDGSEILFCTIDLSRVSSDERGRATAGAIRTAVEDEVRLEKELPAWQCRAVTRDAKAPHRIRIVCRNDNELTMVKGIVEKRLPSGGRVLRDEYYPIKVDGVSRSAILDDNGKELPGLNEALSGENATEIIKVSWLSPRFLQEHGSVVVYLRTKAEAARFLREKYFYAGGLSGTTTIFKRLDKPNQCYNCQELADHKAFQCKKPQVCRKCATEGHHHSGCTETIAKCALCGGPHESSSRSCRRLYPSRNE